MLGKEIRLHRLMPGKDGRYLGVTVDHAIGRGLCPGLDHVGDTIGKLVAGGPNAITMMKGIAENCFGPYAGQVPLVLKLTSFGLYHKDEDVAVASVEEALAMGADAVSVGCIVGGRNQDQQIAQLARYSEEAHRVGLPLISHIYPRGDQIPKEEQYSVENVTYAARVAAELGVDLIKTSYTGSASSFAKVVEAVPARVAIAGGMSCKTVEEFLQMTRDVLDSGAVGVTYGRFLIKYPHVTALTRTLSDMIHEDISCAESLERLREREEEEDR